MNDLKQDLAALRIEREREQPGVGRWVAWLAVLLVVGAAGFGAIRWLGREPVIEVQIVPVT